MKKILCLAFLAFVGLNSATKAEKLVAPIIGIVAQAVLDKSLAFQSIVQQIEKKRIEFQKEALSYETELKNREKKLIEAQKTLPPEQFTKEHQKFETYAHEKQERVEILKAQLELATEDSKKIVFDAYLKAAHEVKEEVGANILMYKETVVTADHSLDLSDRVLDKLNKRLSKVTVVFPSADKVKKQLQPQH